MTSTGPRRYRGLPQWPGRDGAGEGDRPARLGVAIGDDDGPGGRRNANGGRRAVGDETALRAFRPQIADRIGSAGGDRIDPFGYRELGQPAVQPISHLPTAAGVHLNLTDKRVRIAGRAFDRNNSGVPLEPLK